MASVDLLSAAHRDQLAGPLADWLPRRRWFQGKARAITAVRVSDAVAIGGGVLDLFVDVHYGHGPPERYQVPLAAAPHGAQVPLLAYAGTRLTDALAVPEACAALGALVASDERRLTEHGAQLAGRPVTGRTPGPDDAPRSLRAEQSNTSVVFGDHYILKVLRRLEAGVHPDVELTRALTEAGFEHIPAQHGSYELVSPDGVPTALGVLADFVAGGREGWDVATAEAADVAAGHAPVPGRGVLPRLDDLGATVARMHAALAKAFGTQDADAHDLAAWAAQMHAQAAHVLGLAAEQASEVTEAVRRRADDLHGAIEQVATMEVGAGRLVRIHGDLHLGQVLLDTQDRWQLLDFEGEPAKSLAERRQPGPPLRDVAGMLRSFDYCVAQAAKTQGLPMHPLPAALADWRDAARRRLLSGYVREARGLVPAGETAQALLAAFELDKAVYELGYELANRPDWVPIPVGGILRVLAARESGRQP